ncbi:MAG: hypothetical protein ACHRXM_31670 [Isosphaerales bacterium]
MRRTGILQILVIIAVTRYFVLGLHSTAHEHARARSDNTHILSGQAVFVIAGIGCVAIFGYVLNRCFNHSRGTSAHRTMNNGASVPSDFRDHPMRDRWLDG